MKTIFGCAAVAMALGAAGMATAQEAPYTKVLTVLPGLCPETVQAMTAWAGKSEQFGAVAMPVDPTLTSSGCGSYTGPDITAGTVSGAASLDAARSAAMAACEERKPSELAECKVIGWLTYRAN